MHARLLYPTLIAAAALSALAVAATAPKLARLNVEETELSGRQADNMHELARLLSVLQMLKRDPPPALLVSPRDAKDAVRAAILVRAMTPALQARARAYAVQAGEMARQRRLAAVQSEALFEIESAVADQAPEPDAGLLLRAPPKAEGPLRAPDALRAPTTGRVIRRFAEALPGGGQSNGMTWRAPPAARVISPGSGAVQYVGPVKGWGVIVILRLAGGYHLVLAGLDQTSVAVGQSVAAGQAVGTLPQSRQSNPELYLEIREQGAPVDPARWLNKDTG